MPAAPKDITSVRHPAYNEFIQQWLYFGISYDGGVLYPQTVNPLFRPMIDFSADPGRRGANRMVVQNALEDSSDYLTRLYKCPTVNVCAGPVDLVSSTVGSPDTVTMTVPDDMEFLLDNCDLSGESYSQLMLEARRKAAIYGHVFLVTDSTRTDEEPKTEADVQRLGIRPYFRVVLPADMLSWRLDDSGKPVEVLYRVQDQPEGSILDGKANAQTSWTYRYWDTSQWIAFEDADDDIKITSRGVNPLGEVPVTVLYHKKKAHFLGQSMICESSKYMQLLTNWASSLDATMTMQSFSQACLRSENPPSQVAIGSTRIIHLHPSRRSGSDEIVGEADFFYRSPDAAPLQTMWDSFFQVIDLANTSMDLTPEATSDKSHPESGISRAWRWHALSKRLASMALHEQEAARNMFYFAARWMGKPEFVGEITYGTQFNMGSLEQDIQTLLTLQAAGLPASAMTEMKSRAVKKALPNLAPGKATQIDAEMAKLNTTMDRRVLTDAMND